MTRKSSPAPKDDGAAGGQKASHPTVSMRRWLRLTARKHSAAKTATNDSSKAAADALAAMLGQSRRFG
jgi:hypothetical protein